MAYVRMLPDSGFKPIDLNAKGWAVYSQTIGRNGGITINGSVLEVWGYSDPDYDSSSSGGVKTISFSKAKNKTLSISITASGRNGVVNSGRPYLYLYNETTGTQTQLWTSTADGTVTYNGTFIIPDNDTYHVRMYVLGAGGQGFVGRKTIKMTCNACTVN